jgi:hypothetical protein
MTRFRFSLAQLMAIVLYLSLGFAALRTADGFWASATSTLSVVAISTGVVGALVRRGRARPAWIGFAVFGWTYLLISTLPPRASGGLGFGPLPWPPDLIGRGLAGLQPYLRPVPSNQMFMSGSLLTPYEQVGHSLGIVLFGFVGAVVGHLLAMRDERATP